MQKRRTKQKTAKIIPDTSKPMKLPRVIPEQYPKFAPSAMHKRPRRIKIIEPIEMMRNKMLQNIRVHGSLL